MSIHSIPPSGATLPTQTSAASAASAASGYAAQAAGSRPAQTSSAATTEPVTTPSPSPSAGQRPPQQAEPAPQEVEKAARQVQEMLQLKTNNLVFSLDEDSGKTVVRIIDAQTDELIRQIPSEEVIALAKALDEMQERQGSQGMLLKDKA